jgi:hypothetical protein
MSYPSNPIITIHPSNKVIPDTHNTEKMFQNFVDYAKDNKEMQNLLSVNKSKIQKEMMDVHHYVMSHKR